MGQINWKSEREDQYSTDEGRHAPPRQEKRKETAELSESE